MPRYSLDFEPLLLEGHTANLFGSEISSGGISVVCKSVGALPEYQKDFSTLTATTWSYDNEDTNLEMSDMVLAQYRMRVLTDMKVQLKHPASVSQWRSLRTNFYLRKFPEGTDNFQQKFLWMASEFFVWEDTTPRFDLYSELAQSASIIFFSGWRFKMEKTVAPGKIDIWVNGWPSGKV